MDEQLRSDLLTAARVGRRFQAREISWEEFQKGLPDRDHELIDDLFSAFEHELSPPTPPAFLGFDFGNQADYEQSQSDIEDAISALEAAGKV